MTADHAPRVPVGRTETLGHGALPAAERADALRGRVRVLSWVVFALIAALLFAPRPAAMANVFDVSRLPWFNAFLNAVAFCWLVVGFGAIRARRVAVHRFAMTGAMVTSALFLVGYVTYHLFSPGPAHYVGDHRGFYLALLASHVVLAALILPAALNTWIRGYTGAVDSHRRLARPTLAAWLYVSVTGVVVTWMVH